MTVIQWYPGHMAKAKRLMQEDIQIVDMSLIVLDARIPRSSYNPDFDKILRQKPMLMVLNKIWPMRPPPNNGWLLLVAAKIVRGRWLSMLSKPKVLRSWNARLCRRRSHCLRSWRPRAGGGGRCV